VTFKATINEQSVKIGGRPDLVNSCGEEFLYWDQAADALAYGSSVAELDGFHHEQHCADDEVAA
jgi:hypothetical protein